MARRRLAPPTPGMILQDTIPAGIETKSLFPAARAPIAQVAGEASALAALEGVTAEWNQARAEGRMIERLKLDDIAVDLLVRDRMVCDPAEMDALVASLRARGQQAPIEVLDRGVGQSPRYGLISGWRRVSALQEIGAEAALAIVRQPKTAAEAYVAMVEENEIRADISFYERARIVARALEQGVYDDPRSALHGLFGNVSRAKRSKIKSFMTIVAALDDALRFPFAISERAGLDLVRRLDADPGLAGLLRSRLRERAPQSAEDEMALVAAPVAVDRDPPPPSVAPPFDLAVDLPAETVRISGPGVDAGFVRDLQRWLARR